MTSSWQRPVESILLNHIETKHRIIGFTAPDTNAGVSTLCRACAEISARSGLKTLLLDLTRPARTGAWSADWSPDTGDAQKRIFTHDQGYECLIANPNSETRFIFSNVLKLRKMLVNDLSEYPMVLLDLPPLAERDDAFIYPYAAAAACDSVLLVCVRGRVTELQLKNSVEAVRSAGGKITGAVLNDVEFVPTGVQIARASRLFFRSVPQLSDWLERRIPEID